MKFDWWRNDSRQQPRVSAPEIADRARAEEWRRRIHVEDARASDNGLWLNGWSHARPDRPLTVSEAHREMQRHRPCSANSCPRKAAARSTLIRAGLMKPDSSRGY
ncbi:hypothetical protein [Nocardia sp. NPDC051832]|uniref:hypothetical protein n=1 Tax=Nocardia sp. NPDC051832 TaxID=3155673 RepID=UPI003447B8A9